MSDSDTLTADEQQYLRNLAAIGAIREGVREKAADLFDSMRRGQTRNTARTRGYIECLQDLDRTLTTILEGATDDEK